MRGIRIYVEGGGDHKSTSVELRKGFHQFFAELRKLAGKKNLRLRPIPCGSRGNTFDAYKRALKSPGDVFNLLLVDAESPVRTENPWDHLKSRDGWDKPRGAKAEYCHLMVQTMEAWLIADRQALKDFYGRDFHENSLPDRDDVEAIPKADLESRLKNATRPTKKGVYHKTQHAPKILARLRLDHVCKKAPHCRRLVDTLRGIIEHGR